jgi:hypothetical protein
MINSSPKNLELQSIKNKFELDEYKKHMDKLFKNKEILEHITYIKQNRLKTSNDPFEPIINDIVNPSSPSPSPSPSNIESPSSSSFNDMNMRLQSDSNLNLKILGY